MKLHDFLQTINLPNLTCSSSWKNDAFVLAKIIADSKEMFRHSGTISSSIIPAPAYHRLGATSAFIIKHPMSCKTSDV